MIQNLLWDQNNTPDGKDIERAYYQENSPKHLNHCVDRLQIHSINFQIYVCLNIA